jgi:hypothetical protein
MVCGGSGGLVVALSSIDRAFVFGGQVDRLARSSLVLVLLHLLLLLLLLLLLAAP